MEEDRYYQAVVRLIQVERDALKEGEEIHVTHFLPSGEAVRVVQMGTGWDRSLIVLGCIDARGEWNQILVHSAALHLQIRTQKIEALRQEKAPIQFRFENPR
jgi:hypothetical protein